VKFLAAKNKSGPDRVNGETLCEYHRKRGNRLRHRASRKHGTESKEEEKCNKK
jgi:hypothetical protein